MATAVVGARLETVAPRKVTDTTDRSVLLGLIALSVVVHGWVLANAAVAARDGAGFSRLALLLEHPSWDTKPGEPPHSLADVLKTAQHPPGYSMFVWCVSTVVRSVSQAPLPDEMLLSCQIASCIAGVLLVLPTYWLGRMMFDKFAGFAAAVLVTVLPVVATTTSDAVTEGLYLLVLATALLLGVRAVRGPTIGRFLLAGLATGVAYLVRPEGILAAMATGCVVVGLILTRRWQLKDGAAGLTALMVGFFVAAGPYMLLIGRITNKPTGLQILNKMPWNPRQELMNSGQGAVRTPPFAAWYNPAEDGSKLQWVPKTILKETGKAFHYVPMFLAAFGIVAASGRFRAEPWLLVPLVLAGLYLPILFALGYKVDGNGRSYVSERHTLPLVFVGCLFAGYLISNWQKVFAAWPILAKPYSGGVVLGLIVISCLVPLARKSSHDNHVGNVHAGRYLAEVLKPEDALYDPYDWAQFYSGRTLGPKHDNDPNAKRNYAVLEREVPGKHEPQSELPVRKHAKNIAADGRSKVVYHWPTDVPLDDAQVKVYLLERE